MKSTTLNYTKRRNPVILRWLDAAQECGWADFKIATPKNNLIEVENVGFIVKQDDHQVILSHATNNRGEWVDLFYVPKNMIQSIYEIQLVEPITNSEILPNSPADGIPTNKPVKGEPPKRYKDTLADKKPAIIAQ